MKDRTDTLLSELSDDELVIAVLEGKNESFRILFDRHKKKIYNYACRHIGGDKHKAEDITVEVFTKAYRALGSYTAKGRFTAWLYTIASNLCKNEHRKRKKTTAFSLNVLAGEPGGPEIIDLIPDTKGTPSDNARIQEFRDYLEKAIASIPSKYKEALIVCDMEGRSYEEAAQMLNCTIGTIGSRLNRARSRLLKHIKKYYGDQLK